MINLDSVLKSRDITLTIIKVMVFPLVTYGCESWTVKKAECQRIGIFKLWCWRGLLKVSWTARRSNQSILREINPEYSPEWLMLKPKLQFFSHLMQTDDSLERTLMLGKIESRRRRGHQRFRWLDGNEHDAMNMNLGKLREVLRDREAWHAAIYGVAKSWTWVGDWATTQERESFRGSVCLCMYVVIHANIRKGVLEIIMHEESTFKKFTTLKIHSYIIHISYGKYF